MRKHMRHRLLIVCSAIVLSNHANAETNSCQVRYQAPNAAEWSLSYTNGNLQSATMQPIHRNFICGTGYMMALQYHLRSISRKVERRHGKLVRFGDSRLPGLDVPDFIRGPLKHIDTKHLVQTVPEGEQHVQNLHALLPCSRVIRTHSQRDKNNKLVTLVVKPRNCPSGEGIHSHIMISYKHCNN